MVGRLPQRNVPRLLSASLRRPCRKVEASGGRRVMTTTRFSDRRFYRRLFRPIKHVWKRYLRWPMPLWRLRGYARLRLGGYNLRFFVNDTNLWWAWRLWKGRLETSVQDFFQG